MRSIRRARTATGGPEVHETTERERSFQGSVTPRQEEDRHLWVPKENEGRAGSTSARSVSFDDRLNKDQDGRTSGTTLRGTPTDPWRNEGAHKASVTSVINSYDHPSPRMNGTQYSQLGGRSSLPMPRPRTEGAPHFDGKNISTFLHEFDDLCEEWDSTRSKP